MVRPLAVTLTAALLLAAPASAAAPAPAVGTSADQVDLGTVPGAIPVEEGYAIPLKGARPAWYTAELDRRVKDSGGPVAAPLDAPLPSEVGIRPGSWMIAPYGCTMNFVFSKSGDLGIGTAGHCVDRKGQNVVLLTLAPGGDNPVLVDIGTVEIRHDNDVGDDFALVKIRPELHDWVSPTTALIGGPCGGYYGDGPESVWHYGHGLAIGTGGTPRAGVGTKWENDAYGWVGAAMFGDSGSPARVTDLSAAGNLTHILVHPQWLPNVVAGTTISKILKIASNWDLVDSSICPLGSGDSGGDADDGDDDGGGGNGNGPPEDRGGGNGPPDDRGSGRPDGADVGGRTAVGGSCAHLL